MTIAWPRRRLLAWAVALPVLAGSAWAVWHTVDRAVLTAAWRGIGGAPSGVAAALAVYAGAFALRAWAWRRVLPGLSFGHALAGIHVALAGNHLLPLRLGEPLRITSVVRRARVPLGAATASTLTLRAADVLGLGLLAAVLGPRLVQGVVGAWWWALVVPALLAVAAGMWWLRRQVAAGGVHARLPGAGVATATTLAWIAESAVIWQVAGAAGVDLTPVDALLVSVIAVAGQVAAVAPSGFGTYEAAGTAALAALGVDPTTGLAVIVTAHALKVAYALVAGLVALAVPAPGAFGRLRLPRRAPAERDGETGAPPSAAEEPMLPPDAPVVLFLPAHDEEATVADVVGRAPATVGSHPVEVVVIDDGSRDATAAEARRAGARVVSFDANAGLGAAVRCGLADAVARQPAAVAFCDADGEYPPEELERMVGPILEGMADYVVGSRFAGRIERMLVHRRIGNTVLTRWLAFTARTAITDGQSGYRALSASAASAAEIAHDYNYAQVLTLDLLAKGFRYTEVPISYRFREQGRSFIRLGTYLRHVVPTTWRLVNRDQPPANLTA